MALLHVLDASGREWNYPLSSTSVCTIGRAQEKNNVVLNDLRASRYHAHIKHRNNKFFLIDGAEDAQGQVKRSANHMFVNGQQQLEHELKDGDRITIGASALRFEEEATRHTTNVSYDDKPLGHTQLLVSATDVIQGALKPQPTTASHSRDEELAALRRKSDILSLLYEMSKTLGSDFNLNAIFEKATDIILRVTPADRVVALLTNEGSRSEKAGKGDDTELYAVSMRFRDPKREAQGKQLTIGRTITRKVMRERAALLSQDAASDEELRDQHSIVSQGVRSAICAPLVAESGVHGALYADRLDAFESFSRDDLELVTAVAAQTAVAVENARAHERLAREEVARANYGRFLPEYVVRQILENPGFFKLGGANQTITVLFADIRGFTRLSEKTPPEQVVHILNTYFSVMSEVIFSHGGTLDKYIGDGLMALFGAPTATPKDACNALEAAIEMQQRMAGINKELTAEGLHEISIGIGLHTGEATVGYIGSDRRSEYTAIGDTVNLASRLESNATGGQILVSEETAKAAGTQCSLKERAAITVKNRVQPVPLFEVEWQEAENTVIAAHRISGKSQ